MTVCCNSRPDKLVLKLHLQSFLKTFNMNAVKKNMCRSFFKSVTQRAKGSVCYSKVYDFLLRKSCY